jgi:diaminohydroxyphosphoribosylaminopyrimidine deaminase / 5-amino-6-(5-phosphoribosylamino)uracil reductase
VTVPAHAAGGLDLPSLLRALGRRGVTRVLAEGGAGLAAALLRQGLVDRLAWLRPRRDGWRWASGN